MMGDPGLPSTPRRRNRGVAKRSVASCGGRSARLARLAQPRSSSAWKRPIRSKYSQRQGPDADGARLRLDFSNPGNVAPKELAEVRKVLETWKDKLSPKLRKGWKEQLSPKLRHWKVDPLSSKFLSKKEGASSPSTLQSRLASRRGTANCVRLLDDASSVSSSHSPHSGSLSEDKAPESVPDLLSMPIIQSFLNHPFHLSCPPTHVVEFSARALQREVRKLAEELAAKEGRIAELREEAADQENLVAALTAKNRRLSERQAASKEDATSCREVTLYRAADTESTALVPRTGVSRDPRQSSEVIAPALFGGHKEAGASHVEGARKRGRWSAGGNIDYYIDASHTLHDELESVGDLRLVLKEELKSKMEFMNVEQDLLRKEVQHLRRSSEESIRLASEDLESNFEKIMNYVREEEAVRREGIRILQSDLEQARTENSRLEAALREAETKNSRLSDCRAKFEQEKVNVQDPPDKEDDDMPAGPPVGRGTRAMYQSIIVVLLITSVVLALAVQLVLRLEEFHFGPSGLMKVPAYLVLVVLGITVWLIEEK